VALAAGTRLGPYEILAAIGAGGMGEVYRAQDTRLDRVVAIKVLPQGLTAGSQTLERFQREARAASALNHPNICTIYDVGTDPPYIAMELLDGETLQQRLTRGPMDVPVLVDIALAVADALETAHGKGIVIATSSRRTFSSRGAGRRSWISGSRRRRPDRPRWAPPTKRLGLLRRC
jgi:serine/threonine protein kinase